MIRRNSQNSNKRWFGRALVLPIFSLALVIGSSGCRLSAEKLEFERAEKAAVKNDFTEAIKLYRNVVDRYVKTPTAIRAAKEAARISHYELKSFKDASALYKHVVLYAPKAEDRLYAQKKLADLHFSQTLDYQQAIIEYSRLLELPHDKDEAFHYRLAIARSYFYLNNFFQAQVEIDGILKGSFKEDLLFDALLLRSNIYMTTRNFEEAIVTLKRMMDQYPERARAETIGLVLAVTYEEQKNYAKAIETLQAIKAYYPRREFIELKIKTLKERQSYLPGASGLRK